MDELLADAVLRQDPFLAPRVLGVVVGFAGAGAVVG